MISKKYVAFLNSHGPLSKIELKILFCLKKEDRTKLMTFEVWLHNHHHQQNCVKYLIHCGLWYTPNCPPLPSEIQEKIAYCTGASSGNGKKGKCKEAGKEKVHMYRMCMYAHMYENRQRWTKVYFWVSLQQLPLSSVLRIISHLSGWVDKLPGSMA